MDLLPGPATLPLIGARANLLRFFYDPTRFMHRLRRAYGDVVGLTQGRSEYVFAFGAAHNRLILGDTALFHNLDASNIPIRIPPGSALARLYAGLIQMNGPRHLRQRRLMTPAFSRRAVESYIDDVVGVTARQLDAWQIGDARDMAREMSELTLSIAIKILLNLDRSQAGESVRSLFLQWTRLVFSAGTLLLPLDLPGLPFRRLLAVSDRLESALRQIIAVKRAEERRGPDVLSAMLAAHDSDQTALSDEEIVGQTNFLFMAGHATTANALTWILFLLDRHPEVWNAVAEECSRLRDGPPTVEHLHQMTLLDAVVKEGIRLMPPVIWWCRVSTAPFQLDRFHLPAGTKVIQSAFMTHRDPDVYPEPDRFLPERWMCSKPDAFQYCPFSAGPRMCLGSTLAMLESKAILAMIVQRFRATVPAGTRVDARGPMILTPRAGLVMALQRPRSHTGPVPVHGNVHALLDLPPV